MDQSEYFAFRENEKEANLYTASCLRIFAFIVLIVWGLNLIGLFIIPPKIMAIAAIGSISCFMLPTLLCKLLVENQRQLKIASLGLCILGITLLSCAIPKHAVLAWIAPLLLSCHYYSKRLSYKVLIISVICMSISIIVGTFVGEWDPNLLDALDEGQPRNITPQLLFNVVLFFVIPRSMILLGLSTICISLASRTYKLLIRQVRDSVSKRKLEAELNIAAQIQSAMLPNSKKAFPERNEFGIAATMIPAKEVGGDFYDFFLVDDTHLAIVMADVSGKGVPAALFMVIGKTLIKDHTKPGRDLGAVFTKVNNLLCEANSEGLFITAFEAVLDLETGEMVFVNAGHEMPFIKKGDTTYAPYKVKPGFVLAGMEDMVYTAGSLMLAPGDSIFCYTDGVPEATNAQNQLYGMERLHNLLVANTHTTSDLLLDVIKTDIDAFVGDAPQFDDITMLCLEYYGNNPNLSCKE